MKTSCKYMWEQKEAYRRIKRKGSENKGSKR
jgi:hypothetical protein